MSDSINTSGFLDLAGQSVPTPTVTPYEERLSKNERWALDEGFRFFEEQSAAHNALRRIAKRLNDLGVDYAVVGGMALFHHGFRRFTEDVDILVTREDLKVIHARLDGLGYVRPFAMSKNLRDAELGVKIEFLITGDYPGDGKPKPVAFPNPAEVYEDSDGIKFLRLPTFVELKLASGITHPLRGKDLVDVQELIQTLHLPLSFAQQLNPFVRPKFTEIWQLLHAKQQEFVLLLPADTAPEQLQALIDAGAVRDSSRDRANYICFTTTDQHLATKYGFAAEDEYWNEDPGVN